MRERTVTTKLYQFDELSNSAKEKAREWFREGIGQDNWWSESVIEDAATIADLMGIDLRQRSVKLMGGGTRYEPAIYWSGFSSQGDGACFEGKYAYKKGSVKAIKAHAPQDAILHRLAEILRDIQKRYGYKAGVSVRHSGHYSHEYCTEFTDTGERELSEKDFEEVKDVLRRFMKWIYRQLEQEWDWQNADEQVDEGIRANEYEFTEEGERA